MLIFVVGVVLHINVVNAILYQDIELPKATPLPISVWDTFNTPVLSAYDNNLVTSNDLSKLTAYGTTYFHPQTLSTVYGTVKSPNDVIDDYSYYHNGRFLKQYFVAEENIDDINALNSFLSRFMPFVPNNFNVPASKLPNLGFPTIASPSSQPQSQSLSTATPIQNNQINDYYSFGNGFGSGFGSGFGNGFGNGFGRIPATPVQLGSGSLGYVRLPNGAVYLGSGSLGYTNDVMKADQLNEVRNRQSPQASPLTFGETPR